METLRQLEVERKAETLRRGWRELPMWVFCSTTGTLYDHAKINKAFKRGAEGHWSGESPDEGRFPFAPLA